MEKKSRFVKVRVNASGRRIIGIIVVPPPHFRVSDYLNSHDDFLLVKQEKAAISYLEALEEGEDSGSRPKSGAFHPVTITMKNHAGTIEGELFIPEGDSLVGTLNRIRRFVNLRKVEFVNSPERYDFLAVCKEGIILVQEVTRGQ